MEKSGFTKQDNASHCLNSATYSLAMREHSRLELHNKLKNKPFSDGVDLDALLNKLEEDDYLNEDRFVESYIRMRSQKGYGPVKITNELKNKGISPQVISNFMNRSNVDWFELAKKQREKKFGFLIPKEYKDKAKQMRFLFNRGFSTDHLNACFDD